MSESQPEANGREAGDRRSRELASLNAVAEALHGAPDLRHALEQTLALVADLLGLTSGWVWLLDPDTGQFYSAAAWNLPPYLQKPVRMRGWHCWCIERFLEGTLTPKNIDVLECTRLRPAVRRQALHLTGGLQFHASIPVYFRDVPLGIMNVTSATWRELTPDELRFLSTIAYQLGIAIERARLAEAATQFARAEERARIAREIHDTLAQGLTAIALDVEGALKHLESNPQRARARLERALSTSRESLEEARRSVLNLRDTSVPKPLPESLRSLARSFTSDTGVHVQMHADRNLTVPISAEPELLRIAQEALANVRRHANATEVVIDLRSSPRTIRLAVSDDGRGFDPKDVGEDRHGIVGMRERARLLGGRLRVRSERGKGTTITASVPRHEEEGDA